MAVRRVIAGLRIDGRQRLVVLGVLSRREVAVVVVEAVGVIEAILERLAVDVPLAGVIRAIAERLQHLGKQPSPRGAHPLAAALDARHGIAADFLGVVTGEDRRPRRPAAGRVVELREAQAVLCQGVEIRRGDLAAVAAGVGEAHVVGEEDQDIRPGIRG